MATLALKVDFSASKSDVLDRKAIAFSRNVAGAAERINNAAYAGIVGRCPVLTGYMKSTIVKVNAGPASYTRVGAFYGIYVNFGTRNMAAQPFFTQGVMIEGWNQLRVEARTVFA